MDQPSDHIGVTIAEMAAAHHGVPVDTLPPISETVDPDSLETMINRGRPDSKADLYLSFTYASLDIQLRSDETVVMSPHRGE